MRQIRRDDYGFFGPGSPSWKVWTSPTALIGFQRSVVLEHFDPFLAAAVADGAGIYQDPRGRLDRTLAYFLIVAVADGRTAVDQPLFVDAAVVPAARALVRGLMMGDSRPMLGLARRLVPHTAEVLASHLGAPSPTEQRTVTPAQAREHRAPA
jgi:hypothetical protein